MRLGGVILFCSLINLNLFVGSIDMVNNIASCCFHGVCFTATPDLMTEVTKMQNRLENRLTNRMEETMTETIFNCRNLLYSQWNIATV